MRGRQATHGMVGTAELRVWNGMRARCLNPNVPCFHRYGGRGIRICQRWLKDPRAFLEDMGPRPQGRSIDRIDNDGHYSCGKCKECLRHGWSANCRWATPKEQAENTSRTLLVEHGGEKLPVSQWAKRLRISHRTIILRLDRGWPIEDALRPSAALRRTTRPRPPRPHRPTRPLYCAIPLPLFERLRAVHASLIGGSWHVLRFNPVVCAVLERGCQSFEEQVAVAQKQAHRGRRSKGKLAA